MDLLSIVGFLLAFAAIVGGTFLHGGGIENHQPRLARLAAFDEQGGVAALEKDQHQDQHHERDADPADGEDEPGNKVRGQSVEHGQQSFRRRSCRS